MDSLVVVAEDVANNTALRVILYFKIATALIGIVCTVKTCFNFKKEFVSHSNNFLLAMNHFAIVICYCISVIVFWMVTLVPFFVYDRWKNDPSYQRQNLVMIPIECFILRLPLLYFCYSLIFSLFVLAVERLIATIYIKKYERAPISIGITFVIILNVFPAIVTAYVVYDTELVRQSYCLSATNKNAARIQVVNVVIIVSEFVCMLLIHGLLLVNRRRQLQTATLSERYQIGENIRCLMLVIPLIWAHFLITAPISIAYYVYVTYINPGAASTYYFMEEALNWLHIYSVFLPFIRFLIVRKQKQKRQMILQENGVGDGNGNHAATIRENHFIMLESHWK